MPHYNILALTTLNSIMREQISTKP